MASATQFEFEGLSDAESALELRATITATLASLSSRYIPKELRGPIKEMEGKTALLGAALDQAKMLRDVLRSMQAVQARLAHQRHSRVPHQVSLLDANGLTSTSLSLASIPHPDAWDSRWRMRIQGLSGKDMALLHGQFLKRAAEFLPALRDCGPEHMAHQQYVQSVTLYTQQYMGFMLLNPGALASRAHFNCETLQRTTPMGDDVWVQKLCKGIVTRLVNVACRNIQQAVLGQLAAQYVSYREAMAELESEHTALAERLDTALSRRQAAGVTAATAAAPEAGASGAAWAVWGSHSGADTTKSLGSEGIDVDSAVERAAVEAWGGGRAAGGSGAARLPEHPGLERVPAAASEEGPGSSGASSVQAATHHQSSAHGSAAASAAAGAPPAPAAASHEGLDRLESIDFVDEMAAKLQENLEKQKQQNNQLCGAFLKALPRAAGAAFVLDLYPMAPVTGRVVPKAIGVVAQQLGLTEQWRAFVPLN